MPTIEQIRAKMQKLQRQADALIAKQTQKVVDQIRKLMIEHELTTADIEAAAKKRRQRAGSKAGGAMKTPASKTSKSKLPPKYRNPKTGETWSGRARPPAWIANVRDRSKFLIDAPSTAVKPKYRDPATGKTWTGHGRAPAWIAQASDRDAFLIGARRSKNVAAKKSQGKKNGSEKSAFRADRHSIVRRLMSRSNGVARVYPRICSRPGYLFHIDRHARRHAAGTRCAAA